MKGEFGPKPTMPTPP